MGGYKLYWGDKYILGGYKPLSSVLHHCGLQPRTGIKPLYGNNECMWVCVCVCDVGGTPDVVGVARKHDKQLVGDPGWG